MNEGTIKIENLSKSYVITHEGAERYTALRDVISRQVKKLIGRNRQPSQSKEEFWALKDVSFEVKRGEAIGIIGRNGAGKSTLLKILSRITEPTRGRIEINGRVASLLEVGTGFHPELTGRENIFLNGAILGMTRVEIRSKFDEIVDFSGVENFLDTPVKRYSSGMYVRLAFAVAAHLEPEILIIDEVLAVGDAEFQKKCLGKMNQVSKEGRTVLFVSHDLNAMMQLCETGVLMKNGQVDSSGKMASVISTYLSNHKNSAVYENDLTKNNQAFFRHISVTNSQQKPVETFTIEESIYINMRLTIQALDYPYSVFVLVLDGRKRPVFACESSEIKEKMTLRIEPQTLVRGDYSITVFINIPKIGPVDKVEDICNFNIIDNGSFLAKHGDYDYGAVFGRFEWIP